MVRKVVALLFVLFVGVELCAQTPAPPPVKATPQNAAAFLGDWDLNGVGPQGPVSFTLSLKRQDNSLTTVFTYQDRPQTVSDVSMVGQSLSLTVTFTSEQGSYPAVVTLTPSADKVELYINVSNGLAEVGGTAKKKSGGGHP